MHTNWINRIGENLVGATAAVGGQEQNLLSFRFGPLVELSASDSTAIAAAIGLCCLLLLGRATRGGSPP
jgi:hypothetical protein